MGVSFVFIVVALVLHAVVILMKFEVQQLNLFISSLLFSVQKKISVQKNMVSRIDIEIWYVPGIDL